MRHIAKASTLLGCAFFLSACGVGGLGIGGNGPLAIGEDRGFDAGSLSTLQAGIYVDPDGCHIWMIDDGLEGYWSRRRDPVSGLPVCTPIAPANSVVGDISTRAGIQDFRPN